MSLDSFVHPHALCHAERLGDGSCVRAFAYVAASASVGRGCVVGEHATLGEGVILSDRVQIGPGARLADGIVVGEGAVIGPNAVLASGSVGRGAIARPGAWVTNTIPANAIVAGNPGVIVGYVTNDPPVGPPSGRILSSNARGPKPTSVSGVDLYPLRREADLRGSLVAAEFDGLPFAPRRVFAVMRVPSESVRGAHAHRTCSQFLVCLAGTARCMIDDGRARDEIHLDSPDLGLHIPPMIWATQYRYSGDAVLLVLASHQYDAADYIRSYDVFLEVVAASSPPREPERGSSDARRTDG